MTETAFVVKQTNTVGLVKCEVIDEDGSLVAHHSSICLTLHGQQASGR